MAFNRDASFAFEIHVVEDLGFHVFGGDGVGTFEESVGKGRLTVVDMSYDAEIADIFHLLGY